MIGRLIASAIGIAKSDDSDESVCTVVRESKQKFLLILLCPLPNSTRVRKKVALARKSLNVLTTTTTYCAVSVVDLIKRVIALV
jgi:hypothetical protein